MTPSGSIVETKWDGPHLSLGSYYREHCTLCQRHRGPAPVSSCTLILLDVAGYLSKEKDENSPFLWERVSHRMG